MDGIEKITNAEGKTEWTFVIGKVRYTCESWSGVMEILREHKNANNRTPEAVGYGAGTYNGD